MGTDYRGTFVVSWSQTSVDGLDSAPLASLIVGASWSWQGEPVCVDGPSSILRLEQTEDIVKNRRRAARMVHRLVGAALENKPFVAEPEADFTQMDQHFVVSNGVQSYTITLIDTGNGTQPLLMFTGEQPPRNTDLWIVHHTIDQRHMPSVEGRTGGVICFTPGTRILTEYGERPVEDLREGDLVQTKDSGLQEILWTGARRMTGARLFAMPKLRPVRIRAGAFGIGRPEDEFLVSPEHRLIVRGAVAQSLFNESEVLVAAKDLINGETIIQDLAMREVTYVHLMLPKHEVIFANGVETESFHPAMASLSSLDSHDRTRLLDLMPKLSENPYSYGQSARRNLITSEAAILMHEAG